MKKLFFVPFFLILFTACSNDNPYDIPEDTLNNVQEQIADTYLPQSIGGDYEAENIIIRNVCEAEHPMENDNVDYIFEYSTDDDEYSSDIALYSDGEINHGAQYEPVDGTCEEYQYQ